MVRYLLAGIEFYILFTGRRSSGKHFLKGKFQLTKNESFGILGPK